MQRKTSSILAGVAMAASVAITAPVASGDPAGHGNARGDGIVVADGVTQPTFGYRDAIRERVIVESPYDSDRNGEKDNIAIDIMRPAASEHGTKVPVIMDPSPYYNTLGRGNESELKADVNGDGLLDKWPLFYDNYFVPRGYAVVLMDMIGTADSTGCPNIHGTSDNYSAKVVIDWLNGRAKAHDSKGDPVVADWHNGKTGLIGKSYDGTLANAVAASGVDGLETIVPISAISSYYDYTRSNGVIQRGDNYLASLANTITNPERRDYCKPVRDRLSANDGDDSGDYTPFWHVRDYNRDVDNVDASVFITHGLNDENVRPDHFSKWWAGLAENNVQRKLWLSQAGHVDPFDFRRAKWVDTLHRWFDHELYGIKNGIMSEPKADIERATGDWESYEDWPVPGSQNTKLWFGDNALTTTRPAPHGAAWEFQDDPEQSEEDMVAKPGQASPNRLAFLSGKLQSDVHMSGTPTIKLDAAVDDTDTNFGAILVDYGKGQRVVEDGDGVETGSDETCWGRTANWGGLSEDACYKTVHEVNDTTGKEVVTKGIVDGLNIYDRSRPTPLEPGQRYRFGFPQLPEDYVFEEGHRIGVVIVGSYPDYGSEPDENRATISIHPGGSLIDLPIVGGREAAVDAGIE